MGRKGRKASVKVTWNGDKVVAEAKRVLAINAEDVGAFISKKIVESISVGQDVEPVEPRDGTSKARYLRGLEPSSPGEPPRLLSGRLRNTVNHRVNKRSNGVRVTVGAYTPYAAALEFGNPRRGLKQRPYMRPAISQNYKTILKKFSRGLFKDD